MAYNTTHLASNYYPFTVSLRIKQIIPYLYMHQANIFCFEINHV